MSSQENMYLKMKEAGRISSLVIEELKSYLKPGLNGEEINSFCHELIINNGAWPAPLEKKFPKSICLSINDVVCHGIPSKNIIIKDGDIVSIDVSCSKDGYYGDNCYTYIIGTPKLPIHKVLVQIAYDSMNNAIQAVKAGVPISTLGYIMHKTAKDAGFDVIREYAGHGIGTELHMAPNIPFYRERETGVLLKAGEYITIEPMVVQGSPKLKLSSDGWTARVKGYSAQFERTLLVTSSGYEIMTDYIFDK